MDNTKETYYHIYCPTCKHQQVPEDEHPCHDCLNEPYQIDSHKPAYYEKGYTIENRETLNGQPYQILKKVEEQ